MKYALRYVIIKLLAEQCRAYGVSCPMHDYECPFKRAKECTDVTEKDWYDAIKKNPAIEQGPSYF